MNLRFETMLPVEWKTVCQGFNQKLFTSLTPPGLKLQVVRFDGCSPGDVVHVLVGSALLRQNWVSQITAEEWRENEWFFIDEGKQLPWPIKRWKHLHRVVALGDKSSMIVDDIHYECAWGLTLLVYPFLWLSFAVRPSRYRKFFQGL